MVKKLFKRFFKKNRFFFNLSSYAIYYYLRITYQTIEWKFIWSSHYDNIEDFFLERGAIFAFWHNRLAIAPRIFLGHKDVYALVSPHSDGALISSVINKFHFGVINGSTNKNSTQSLRELFRKLLSGSNIVITPDGPRGPIYKINSNITKIAKKYNSKLIPIACYSTNNFTLKSWDRLIIPKIFSSIIVIIGNPLILCDDQKKNDEHLEQTLIAMNKRAKEHIR
jgi:lysophospholipid acyltransferase (LPLAT)-like uncharacterized protein